MHALCGETKNSIHTDAFTHIVLSYTSILIVIFMINWDRRVCTLKYIHRPIDRAVVCIVDMRQQGQRIFSNLMCFRKGFPAACPDDRTSPLSCQSKIERALVNECGRWQIGG